MEHGRTVIVQLNDCYEPFAFDRWPIQGVRTLADEFEILDHATECYLVNYNPSMEETFRYSLASRFVILAELQESVVFMNPGRWIARWFVFDNRFSRIDHIESTDAVWVGMDAWNKDRLFKARLEIYDPPKDAVATFVVEHASLSKLALDEHRPVELWRKSLSLRSDVSNLVKNHDQLLHYL